jgi:hypothetical protein
MRRFLVRGLLLAVVSLWTASAQPADPNSAGDAASSRAGSASPPASDSSADAIHWGNLIVSGSVRTRVEAWDWFDSSANGNYTFSDTLIRLSLSQILNNFDWQLEFAVPILLGLPDNALAPAPQLQAGLGANYYSANHNSTNAAMIFPKQGYLRFKHLFDRDGDSVRVGRFEFFDGAEVAPKDETLAALKRDHVNQRLIGNFGFADVERSFDGAQFTAGDSRWNLTGMSALPTRGVFQVDGWGNLRTSVSYLGLTRQLPGQTSSSEWRLFGIYYDDFRHVLKTDNRPAAVRSADMDNIKLGTYGGHFINVTTTPAGPVDFTLWGAFQTGAWGRQSDRAEAYDAEIGWQPRVLTRLRPWLRGTYTYGSGDKNPSDGEHGTFFQLLPTPRVYARYPFYNMMNLEDAAVELSLRPSKRLTLRSDFHSLRLASASDLWYVGGGAFQPWTFGFTGRNAGGARSLANLWDLSADYAFNTHFAAGLYYGYADGKAVMHKIYPHGPSSPYGFVELNYKF